MQGIKRKRRCEIECKEHILAIQSLKANSSKYDIKLLFCPKFQRQPLPPEHTYPQYNNDGKFYTSAFILGVDRRVLLKNQQQELMDHQKQIRDSLEKHNQLIFPRPTSKHSLCSVCKQHYKNYYYHISSEQHREKIAQSHYNIHIKELCNIYIDQWEGAEERADEEAEKRALEEEERRQQNIEMTVRENEEDSESLLDVQRGEQQDNDGDDEDADATYNAKPSKKYVKDNFKDDDTIPFTARTTKRSAPEGRVYTSQYLRKKFVFNNPVASQDRAQRQRQQRRYERQRDKIRSGRDNPENPKEFIKADQKQGDVFVIMKAAHVVTQAQVEFVWKRTSEKLRKQLEREPHRGALVLDKTEGSSEKYEKENKKYEIDYSMEEKYIREQRQGNKIEVHPHGYYPQLNAPQFAMPQYKAESKLGQYKKAEMKGDEQRQVYEPCKHDQKDQRRYPYYYSPYMYPPVYQPYHPSDIGSESSQKEKLKKGQKSFNYPPVPYWPYPPPSYYSSPITQTHSELNTTNSKSKPSNTASNNPVSTNININFPMYVCPPPLTQSSPYSIQATYSAPMPHHPYPNISYQSHFVVDKPSGKEEDLLYPKVSYKKGGNQVPHFLYQPQITSCQHSQGLLSHPNAQPYQSYPPHLAQFHYPLQSQPAQKSRAISG